VTRLHHVQVSCPVGGESAARAFYGELLGLTEVIKPPALVARGGVWFRDPGVELHVGVEDPFTPARKAHPALLVEHLDAVADRLAAAGHKVTWNDDFPSYRRCHTHDAAGNRIELLGELP
jgi:catechol 2,3-dioxygenase-like lactoylglutathione lyase family enzyme